MKALNNKLFLMKNLILLLSASLFLIFSSCKKNSSNVVPVCDGSTPTYDTNVEIFISGRCLSCHGTGSSNGDMSSYAKLSAYTSNGKFEKEVLTNQSMPTSGPLPESELNMLKCWMGNGFPEN